MPRRKSYWIGYCCLEVEDKASERLRLADGVERAR